MQAITKLLALVKPPATPSEIGSIKEWKRVEKKLGVALPEDYREFVFHFGSGLFANFIRVFNPFSEDQYISLVPSVMRICDINRHLKESEGDEEVPYPIYPEKGGILPWGNDENGNTFYWLAERSPEVWPVVLGAGRSRQWERFDCDLTTFLYKALKREICPSIWPSAFPDDNTDFVFESY